MILARVCERGAPMGFQSAVRVLRAAAHARTLFKIADNDRYFRFSTSFLRFRAS